ncbi:Coiled-coil domain-containing protein [Toxocara canis]|uniref:Coiled-coil domain-containing protein n=1 Tax=Toxocara canis TaxID=6265 RepID=A0A0B2V166_TOXCA|nr:Coiled-coil domain-containing protein [Toxocara canis]
MMFSQHLVLIRRLLIIAILVNNSCGKVETHSDKHHDGAATVGSFSKSVKDERLDSESHAKLYRNALKLKRREQLNAVKTILAIDNAKKRKVLVLDLVSGMQKVIDEAKQLIEKANYNAGDAFPFANTQLKEAIGNVVENTAFFCEFALRFPSIIGKKYLNDYKLRSTIDWAYKFSEAADLYDEVAQKLLNLCGQELNVITRYLNDYKLRSTIDWAYKFSEAADLYDEVAQKLLNLCGQELNVITREENFVNPYDKKFIKEEIEREAVRRMKEAQEKKAQQKKMEKMKKKERKPTLSKTEL